MGKTFCRRQGVCARNASSGEREARQPSLTRDILGSESSSQRSRRLETA